MRILLISHMGALFAAEYIRKYLVQEKHTVVTVGRFFDSQVEQYNHTRARMGSTHLPLFWKGEKSKNGMPIWTIDINTIFDMLGTDWDAIIECECFNLKTEDNFDLIDKMFDIPYFFYKTQFLEDYVPGHATHVFYAAEKTKKKLLENPEWNYEWQNSYPDMPKPEDSMTYLPLTVDPDIVKVPEGNKIECDMFFAGNYPTEEYTKNFKDIYKDRKKIIDHVEANFNGKCNIIKDRKWKYDDYIKEASKSLIMLNCGIGGLNIRDFEAMALGKILITKDNPEYLKNGFIAGGNCIRYTSESIEYAHNFLDDLLQKPGFMKSLSDSAYKMFMEQHHPKQRIKTILEAIENANAKSE